MNADPYCILKVPDSTAVSVAILISRLTSCPFAAKSGGHAAFVGASNIEGGITISLENLNSIKVSSDKKTVAVGAGNKWAQVYSTLAKSDLAVIGGRVAPIGVGGLTTGGGISFFSNIYGWACVSALAIPQSKLGLSVLPAKLSWNTPMLSFRALAPSLQTFNGKSNKRDRTMSFPTRLCSLPASTQLHLQRSIQAFTGRFAVVVSHTCCALTHNMLTVHRQ